MLPDCDNNGASRKFAAPTVSQNYPRLTVAAAIDLNVQIADFLA